MHRLESLSSQDLVVPYSDPPFEKEVNRRHLKAFTFLDATVTVQILYSQLSKYYHRRLSYHLDIINAFSGIMKASDFYVMKIKYTPHI
jgi:hypothetical protein